MLPPAGVVKLADARDSKSRGVHSPCGFDSHLRHQTSLAFGELRLGKPVIENFRDSPLLESTIGLFAPGEASPRVFHYSNFQNDPEGLGKEADPTPEDRLRLRDIFEFLDDFLCVVSTTGSRIGGTASRNRWRADRGSRGWRVTELEAECSARAEW